MAVVWKFINYNADANKVAEEIENLGESASPQAIVDYARNTSSELNKCFEWDDSIAGERYRLYQARQIVCNLVYDVKPATKERPEPVQLRVFQSVASNNYKPMKVIVKNADEYESLIAKGKAELRAFKNRYESIAEFSEIIALID